MWKMRKTSTIITIGIPDSSV